MKFIFAIVVFLTASLSGSFTGAQATPLPVNEAFKLQVTGVEDGKLNLSWAITGGYYLYRDHIEATGANGTALIVDTLEGQHKNDPTFGAMEVYYNRATAAVALNGAESVEITYQGCQEDGICYRPEKRLIDLQTLAVSDPVANRSPVMNTVWAIEKAPVEKAGVETPVEQAPVEAASATEPLFQIADDKGMVQSLLEQGGTAFVLASFLVFGLLLAFTPCVFPMYPIVTGALAREGDRLTPWRGFMLTAIYVVSLASAFALIGAAAGWSGQNLQMLLQSPWIALAVAIIFVVLALSMFGLFELQLPSRWTSAITRRTGGRTGSKTSAAVLGFSSVLIVGPCVTAPLAGALLYIAQTANVALGAAALFALGIGKGIPLVVMGTLGGKALPRAGSWMEHIKRIFGFGFLATAIWMAAPLLPAGLDLVLWAVLLFALASFAFFTPWVKVKIVARSIGITALVYGVILMLGAASGGTDPLRPLSTFANRSTNSTFAELRFDTVTSAAALQAKLAPATDQRPTLVYFTADWCVACHIVERSVFPNSDVRRALDGFQLIKADVSRSDPANLDLMAALNVAGPPTMIFFNHQAVEVSGTRLVGNVSAQTIARSAQMIGSL